MLTHVTDSERTEKAPNGTHVERRIILEMLQIPSVASHGRQQQSPTVVLVVVTMETMYLTDGRSEGKEERCKVKGRLNIDG